MADVDVVWISPETLDRANGEFRVYEGEVTETVALSDGSEIQGTRTELGPRAVWVDENPNDVEDASGHFEVYDGPEDEYLPVSRDLPNTDEQQEENE